MLIERLVAAGKRVARVAGGLYLLIVVLGGIAHLAVRAGLHVPGYEANTAQNIAAGPTLDPVSLATDLAITTIFALVGVTVHLLLRRIDRRAPGVLVVFVAMAAGLILINLAFHHAAQLVAAGSGSSAVGSHRSDGLVVRKGEPPYLGPPKRKPSRRDVPAPRVLVKALAEHLSAFPSAPREMVCRDEAGRTWAEVVELVFTTARGEPLTRSRFGDAWRVAVKTAGLPAGTSYHDLRHFYASLLIDHGESVKVVQRRLGHASATETLDTYSHLWPDSEDRTRDAVDSVLDASSCEPSVSQAPFRKTFPQVRGVEVREPADKPDPVTYAYVLSRLRVSAAAAAYIGDGSSDELVGARSAGFGMVILAEEAAARSAPDELPRLRAQADASVLSLPEVVDLVNR